MFKAVMLGTEDITDVPREFRLEDSGRIQAVFTSRWAQLSGTVVGDKGEPITDRTVLLFSEDRTVWVPESSRIRQVFVQDGGFLMSGMRAGRYYLAVLPRDTRWDSQKIDKGLLEKLATESTPVVIGEHDRREVVLKVASGGH